MGDDDEKARQAHTKRKKKGAKQAQPSLRPCDRAAVAYRSEDPLENLKIRVQLKSLSVQSTVRPEPQPREPKTGEDRDEGEDNEDEASNEEDNEANADLEPEPVR